MPMYDISTREALNETGYNIVRSLWQELLSITNEKYSDDNLDDNPIRMATIDHHSITLSLTLTLTDDFVMSVVNYS